MAVTEVSLMRVFVCFEFVGDREVTGISRLLYALLEVLPIYH